MNLKPFLSWCASQGISSSIQIKQGDDSFRYAVWSGKHDHPAHDTIPDNDDKHIQLLKCPLTACITAPSSHELAERLSQEMAQGESSTYFPYLQTLPTMEFYRDTMPRFWSKQRLQTVTDSGCLRQALREDEARVSMAKDPWALAVVDSRSHFLPDRKYSLTPILDMINHDSMVDTKMNLTDGNLSLFVDKQSITSTLPSNFFTKLVAAVSNNPLKNQVCITYGDFTNLHTLVHYGFVAPNNPHNTETLFVSLLRQPTLRIQLSQSDGRMDLLSLGTMRRALATSEETNKLIKNSAMVPFLSRRNELEVYAVITSYLEDAIAEATKGANAAYNNDPLVYMYLTERANTLTRARTRIEKEFPQLFQ